MDNRRPPRNNSSGQGKYYDRSRTGGSPRGPVSDNIGNTASGDSRFGPPVRGRGAGGPPRPGDKRPNFGGGPSNGRGRFGAKPTDGRGKKAVTPQQPAIKITSDLQVMDGKFLGRLLVNAPSPKAATMSRSLRDSMFRLIARRVRGARFLDLCAGCGMVGLEAISRGSMLSTFVERSARATSYLKKNIAEMQIKDGHAEVVEMEALPFLNRAAGRRRKWDIVFLSRTDDAGSAELLEFVSRGRVIEIGGVAIIEHSADAPLPEKLGTLTQFRTINKDGVAVTFFNRK
jgi:16S rRNA (guanine(966)-N(2))-methyltransferase RsmD